VAEKDKRGCRNVGNLKRRNILAVNRKRKTVKETKKK
jgi:hypothetical protein